MTMSYANVRWEGITGAAPVKDTYRPGRLITPNGLGVSVYDPTTINDVNITIAGYSVRRDGTPGRKTRYVYYSRHSLTDCPQWALDLARTVPGAAEIIDQCPAGRGVMS